MLRGFGCWSIRYYVRYFFILDVGKFRCFDPIKSITRYEQIQASHRQRTKFSSIASRSTYALKEPREDWCNGRKKSFSDLFHSKLPRSGCQGAGWSSFLAPEARFNRSNFEAYYKLASRDNFGTPDQKYCAEATSHVKSCQSLWKGIVDSAIHGMHG